MLIRSIRTSIRLKHPSRLLILTSIWLAFFATTSVASGPRFAYATMSDGAKIALAIAFPEGAELGPPGKKWPAILTMSGYPPSVQPLDPKLFGSRYVMVSVSQRGAGASSGTFALFDRRIARDGYEVIENWIVKQTWSNGKVGVVGHSWSGLNGFQIASTNPPSLKAVTVSGLVDDGYRGILYPGGIRNSGFPISWLNSTLHEAGVFRSDEAAIEFRSPHDELVSVHQASRFPRDLLQEMLWKALQQPHDNSVWRQHSLVTYADGIRAPIHIAHAYQDEQTGPRGVILWEKIADDVPKRLVLTNGSHGAPAIARTDRQAWLDCWILRDGQGCQGDIVDPDRRVRVHFDTTRDGRRFKARPPLVSGDFPLPETQWTRYFLRRGAELSTEAPTARDEARYSYDVKVGVSDNEIERVSFSLPVDTTVAVAGPITLTLWASSTTLDTDFFVLLLDVDRNGNRVYLQRGLLRASFRALDEERSDWVTVSGRRELIRPYHPYRNPEPLRPRQPYQFQIEVFVVGHIFRQGHTLAVEISQPPLADPVVKTRQGGASYQYDSDQPPGTVTILSDSRHPSSILLPVLPHGAPTSSER